MNQLPTAISEELIADVVSRFYSRVRKDTLIGPIFEAAIPGDWAEHLVRICDFWSGALLTSGRYRGNPMMIHLHLPRLRAEHFERWLHLWSETVMELCSDPARQLFISKAETIAERLLSGIDLHHSSIGAI